MQSKVIGYKFGKEVYREDFNSYKDAYQKALDKNRFENMGCVVLTYDELRKRWQKQTSLYVKESY